MSTHYRFPKSVYLVLFLIFSLMLPAPRQTHAQTPLTTLESDDAQVEQSGIWTIQTTAAASGGGYLYSNGSEADILTLNFSGTSVEIVYISGPSLGTLAIEIDDTVLRTVITTDSQTRYAQSAKIDYLKDTPHTLRVYAQEGGTIAIDAFLISPSLSLERGPGGEVNPAADILTETTPPQAGPFCAGAPADSIHRILGTGAVQGGDATFIADMTPDGRYVVIESDANNLVVSDTNTSTDVFVFDRVTCTIERVSVDSSELQANDDSLGGRISADGRYVVFQSTATNLTPSDTNGNTDIFRRDRTAGTTIRITRTFDGLLPTGGNSIEPDISADGRFIVYQSASPTIVADDTNGVIDIFMRDMSLQITHRVSLPSGGSDESDGNSTAPAISADGSTLVYQSIATNLVTGDTNGISDIFAYDLKGTTGTTRVSVATSGAQADSGNTQSARVSANGRYVVFNATATNLVTGDTNGGHDVFLRDRQTNTTTRLSISSAGLQANNQSVSSAISDDGRFVTFHSQATNLVTGDTNSEIDVFVRDRLKNTTTRVSLSATGTQGDDSALNPRISGNGRYIAFNSAATNLVTGDTNASFDAFIAPNPTFLLPGGPDTLALFNPTFNATQLVNTLTTNPPAANINLYNMTPPATGQWVMGDWDSDGDDTPGVYANGPFFYTNDMGQNTVWRSLWIGVPGAPVSGRFNANFDNDCIGAVQQASLGGSTVFVLYFTCDLSGTAVPAISSQWLSAVLPDSGGFTGTHQFASGDFNNDRLDSVAVRRGDFIAFGNVAPSVGDATFDLAQFIGNPGTGASVFLSGDWNNDGLDSFGLYYANGVFFRRDDLLFNSGTHTQQATTPLIGTGLTAHAWR